MISDASILKKKHPEHDTRSQEEWEQSEWERHYLHRFNVSEWSYTEERLEPDYGDNELEEGD